MVWLVTHIWLFIGLAALFGLILGWAVRGIRVSGGARRAVVERNIALTELDQVRAELDSLYTAQRVQGSDGQIHEELQAREARISDLEAALNAAREEVVMVKADGEKKLLAAAAASAVVAGAGVVVAGGGQENVMPTERLDANVNDGNAQLEWRNRYLESRVRSLESITETEAVAETGTAIVEASIAADMSERVAELEAGNDALQTQIASLEQQLEDERGRDQGLVAGVSGAALGAGAALVGQGMIVDEADAASEMDTVERDKLAWQNDYLRQRLAFMEEHGISDATQVETTEPSEASTALAETETLIETVVPETVDTMAGGTDAEPNAEPGDIEQELARLRWRNRYLEGRLAYIDGGASSENVGDAGEEDDAKQSAAEALLERLERSDATET